MLRLGPCRTSSAVHHSPSYTPSAGTRDTRRYHHYEGPLGLEIGAAGSGATLVFTKTTKHIGFIRAAVAKPLGDFPLSGTAQTSSASLLQVNETQPRTRYDQLRSFQRDKVGQRHKSAMADGFDRFMRSRSDRASGWEDASPEMAVEWLRFIDPQGNGTTIIVHATSCPQVKQYSLYCSDRSLGGTRRYAFGSLQKSFVYKLNRPCVEIVGRFEKWSPQDMRGNPVTGTVVDQYFAFATQEQLRAGVKPKQATPILRPDLQHLMCDMHTCLICAAQPVDRLAYTCDMALFAVAFSTGSRGSDLVKLLAAQVLHLPSSQELVLNFHFTKTLTRWGRASFPPGA